MWFLINSNTDDENMGIAILVCALLGVLFLIGCGIYGLFKLLSNLI